MASHRLESSRRIWVEDSGRRRPFMRGIMIHSLMARGVSFENAYLTANTIRDRLRGRDVVPVDEVAKAVREIVGSGPFEEEHRLQGRVDVLVTGRGGGRPFSKGILSQSLLAAALDPNEAFDVAREIERELASRGGGEVSRRDLRRLSYETLGREISAQAAERYLVWRHYQDSDRPVIIMLGGATGVGKTSLALEVAHRLGIGRVLSTDSIRQIMRIMLSQELVPVLHASSFDAHLQLPPDASGEDPVVRGFVSQAASVSVGVRASMDRAVSENANLVLDGVSLVPGMIDLRAYSGVAHVFFMVVAALDEEAIAERFKSRAEGASQRIPTRYLEHLDSILRIQDHFLELADRYDVPIVDNVLFDRSVLFIIRHVAEALRQRDGFDAETLL